MFAELVEIIIQKLHKVNMEAKLEASTVTCFYKQLYDFLVPTGKQKKERELSFHQTVGKFFIQRNGAGNFHKLGNRTLASYETFPKR